LSGAHLTLPIAKRWVPSLSALGGGEGIQLLGNPFEHTRQIVDHFAIPEANYTIAAACQLFGASGVIFRLGGVLSAVRFDRELPRGTGEIDDVWSDRVLSPQAMSSPRLAQRLPEPIFNLCRVLPQAPRQLRLRPQSNRIPSHIDSPARRRDVG
jgi:hypothetical protein